MAFNSDLLLRIPRGYGEKWKVSEAFSNVGSTVGGKARAARRGESVSTMAFAGFSGRELEGMQFSSDVLCAFHRFDDELLVKPDHEDYRQGKREAGSISRSTVFLRVFDQFR